MRPLLSALTLRVCFQYFAGQAELPVAIQLQLPAEFTSLEISYRATTSSQTPHCRWAPANHSSVLVAIGTNLLCCDQLFPKEPSKPIPSCVQARNRLSRNAVSRNVERRPRNPRTKGQKEWIASNSRMILEK